MAGGVFLFDSDSVHVNDHENLSVTSCGQDRSRCDPRWISLSLPTSSPACPCFDAARRALEPEGDLLLT